MAFKVHFVPALSMQIAALVLFILRTTPIAAEISNGLQEQPIMGSRRLLQAETPASEPASSPYLPRIPSKPHTPPSPRKPHSLRTRFPPLLKHPVISRIAISPHAFLTKPAIAPATAAGRPFRFPRFGFPHIPFLTPKTHLKH
eukprot:Gb_39806 [translate_table: standard]